MSSLAPVEVAPQPKAKDLAALKTQLDALFDQPNLIPDKAMAYIADYIAINMPQISIGNIVGSTRTTQTAGRVDSAGVILGGTGFTVNHSGTGVYDITYDTAFTNVPAVLATPFSSSTRFLSVSASSTTGCTIQISNSAGAAQDQAFIFTAIALS